MRQNRLEMGRDTFAFGEAVLAIVMATQRPQVWTIVDIKGHLATGRTRKTHGGEAGSGDTLGTEMRSGYQNRLCRCDEVRIDVRLVDRHVGAVLSIEDQRKLLAVTNAEDDKRTQTIRIGRDVARVDTFPDQLFADKAPHMLIADPCDESRFQTEAGTADADVGRASSDIFGETGHVLETAANLSPIKIHRRTPDADHVQGRVSHSLCPCHVSDRLRWPDTGQGSSWRRASGSRRNSPRLPAASYPAPPG